MKVSYFYLFPKNGLIREAACVFRTLKCVLKSEEVNKQKKKVESMRFREWCLLVLLVEQSKVLHKPTE